MSLCYYYALLEPIPGGMGFGGVFPNLLGCISYGDSQQNAAVQAAGQGDPNPARVLVPVEIPGRAVQVNITMDEGLLARLDAAAQAEGNTRSGFLAQAVRERLRAAAAPA